MNYFFTLYNFTQYYIRGTMLGCCDWMPRSSDQGIGSHACHMIPLVRSPWTADHTSRSAWQTSACPPSRWESCHETCRHTQKTLEIHIMSTLATSVIGLWLRSNYYSEFIMLCDDAMWHHHPLLCEVQLGLFQVSPTFQQHVLPCLTNCVCIVCEWVSVCVLIGKVQYKQG